MFIATSSVRNLIPPLLRSLSLPLERKKEEGRIKKKKKAGTKLPFDLATFSLM